MIIFFFFKTFIYEEYILSKHNFELKSSYFLWIMIPIINDNHGQVFFEFF